MALTDLFRRRSMEYRDEDSIGQSLGNFDPEVARRYRSRLRAQMLGGPVEAQFAPGREATQTLAARIQGLTQPVQERPSFFQRLSGFNASPAGQRLRSVLTGAAPFVDPTAEGMEGFLGSAIRSYVGGQQAAEEQAQADAERAEAAELRPLRRRLLEAQIDNAGTRGQISQPKGIYERNAVGGPVLIDPVTGESRRVDVEIAPPTRATPTRVDPLSTEGIRLGGERARVIAEATAGVGMTGAVREKVAMFDALDQGIDELTKGGGLLERYPESIGLRFVGPDQVNQRLDPKGVDLRAAIANVTTQLLNLRSGAAVSEGEYARLVPLIPTRTDTPQAARAKLQRLRTELRRMRVALTTPTGQVPSGQETLPRSNPLEAP